MGAIWQYHPTGLHAKDLAGTKHMDYYFNSNYIVGRPQLLERICTEVFLPELERRQVEVDWVLSYPPFGLPIAYCLAALLKSKFAYIEKEEIRFNIKPAERILLVSDDIYTGGSLNTTAQILSKRGLSICDLVLVLANLSESSELFGRKIVCALNRPITIWDAGECPLCKDGSEAIGARSNWQRLLSDRAQVQAKTAL